MVLYANIVEAPSAAHPTTLAAFREFFTYPLLCFSKCMNQKLFLLTTVLVLGLIGCQLRRAVTAPQPPATSVAPVQATYQVKRIADGDTITVVDSQGADIKVRFACIDAPEVPHSKKE